MKLVTFAAIVFLFASRTFAGITYDFQSITRGGSQSRLTGKVAAEGKNLRLDIATGDNLILKDNSVVLSGDGGKTLLMVDPAKKSYTELRLAEMLGSLGAMKGMFDISISNQKVKVSDSGNGGLIEDYPTKKYVVDASYDMTLNVMSMKTMSKFVTRSETWTTERIPAEYTTFLQQRGLTTGIEDVDRLLASQTQGMKGFPMKVITTTVTTAGGKSQTSTTTMTVSKLQMVTVPASRFAVPAGFVKKELDLGGVTGK